MVVVVVVMMMEQLSQDILYDDDILDYVVKLKIPYFVGVKMRDELLPSTQPKINECGILNLNTHLQKGSHWTCWYKRGKNRFYFDSFGEPPPPELLHYLKTPLELEQDLPVIKCNAITVQHDQSDECGSLCLYVLKQMSRAVKFSSIIEFLEMRYNKKLPTPPLFC